MYHPGEHGDHEELEMYSDKNLLMRESMRFDPGVILMLDKLWCFAKLLSANTTHVSSGGYCKVYSKVYRCLLQEIAQAEAEEDELSEEEVNKYVEKVVPSVDDAMKQAVAEFKQDSKGLDTMDKKTFTSSWYEIADLWTESLSTTEYTNFLEAVYNHARAPEEQDLEPIPELEQDLEPIPELELPQISNDVANDQMDEPSGRKKPTPPHLSPVKKAKETKQLEKKQIRQPKRQAKPEARNVEQSKSRTISQAMPRKAVELQEFNLDVPCKSASRPTLAKKIANSSQKQQHQQRHRHQQQQHQQHIESNQSQSRAHRHQQREEKGRKRRCNRGIRQQNNGTRQLTPEAETRGVPNYARTRLGNTTGAETTTGAEQNSGAESETKTDHVKFAQKAIFKERSESGEAAAQTPQPGSRGISDAELSCIDSKTAETDAEAMWILGQQSVRSLSILDPSLTRDQATASRDFILKVRANLHAQRKRRLRLGILVADAEDAHRYKTDFSRNTDRLGLTRRQKLRAKQEQVAAIAVEIVQRTTKKKQPRRRRHREQRAQRAVAAAPVR
jgi:hypothetical protein